MKHNIKELNKKKEERRNMKYDRIYTGNEEIVEKSNDMGKILPL